MISITRIISYNENLFLVEITGKYNNTYDDMYRIVLSTGPEGRKRNDVSTPPTFLRDITVSEILLHF